jgi:4-amino-4-deoxy-L-arabinose transferase-like glycosyltransferase
MGLLYLLTRRLSGPGVAVIAALLLPCLPAYYVTSWDILSHAPTLTLFLLIALLAPRACEHGRPALLAALGIGALCGVAITIRPTSVLFVVPPLAMLMSHYSLAGRGFWHRAAAIGAGAAPFVGPLLWSNYSTFGTLTRTGYSYWCALIYDLPGRSFRFDVATLREGLRFYGIPIVLEPDLGRVCSLQLLGLVACAGQIVLGLVRAFRGTPAQKDYALFALATVATILGLYLPYTFRFYWFAHPAYACLLPFVASGLSALWLGLDNQPRAGRFRVAGLLVILVFSLGQRSYLPLKDYNYRERWGRQVRKLKAVIPRDAVFISNRDPLTVYEELGRGTRRVCMPLNRASEYAWTQTTPRPPTARTPEAIAAASKPVFPVVFEEDPATFLHQYPGRRIFLETVTAGSYTGTLPAGFNLVPVETGATVVLYEVVPRPASGE